MAAVGFVPFRTTGFEALAPSDPVPQRKKKREQKFGRFVWLGVAIGVS